MLDPEEVKSIEKTTPFIKTGTLRKADDVADDENLLANMKLSELAFEEKIIGKGSYGSDGVQFFCRHRLCWPGE